MYTPDFVWRLVKNWTDKGLIHPAPVEKWVTADKDLDTYLKESDRGPEFDLENIGEYIEAQALHLALNGETRSRAIAGVRSRIETNGINAARENIDGYVSQLTERFESAAGVYVTESAKLPEVFAGEDLAGFDTETFAAYRATTQAFDEIKMIREFLTASRLVTAGNGDSSRFNIRFLVLEPGTVENYATVQFSDPSGSADRAYEAVDPVMMRAVRNGAELRIVTPNERDAECAEYEAELDAMHAEDTARVMSRVIR